MKKVLIGSSKGGTGKSLLSFNLAIASQIAGRRVGVIDADRQASLTKALEFREQAWSSNPLRPSPMCRQWRARETGDGSRLEDVFSDLEAAGAEMVFVDVGGFASRSLIHGIGKTDLWVLPTGISAAMVDGTRDSLELAKEMRDKGVPFNLRLLLNQVPQSTQKKLYEQYWQIFGKLPHFKTELAWSPDYASAEDEGLGVVEYRPSKKAAEAIRSLYNEIEGVIK